jgi:predicted CoA-binding protein
MNVAVLGASNKADRYSYKAVILLKEKGHTPYPVHPTLTAIEGLPVFASLRQVPAPLDVVTLYLGPPIKRRFQRRLSRVGRGA